MAVPRGPHAIPGPFPGKVVEVVDPRTSDGDTFDAGRVRLMFLRGLKKLSGKSPKSLFSSFFTPDDLVGIKVNPVGPGLISTRHEVVEAIIGWLVRGGIPEKKIIIWDRFDSMLADAGFTPERYPGIGIEGLQTMDERFSADSKDRSGWADSEGNHKSVKNFDGKVTYWADVEAPKDDGYLNQHVVNTKHSPFGRLLTERLTKIINVAVFKSTGNGISMATKNLGYAAICNTGRLHKPLFFDVCTEVLAFPAIRDKLVLNVTDALVGQYEGGPMANPRYIWTHNRLFLGTDPFALDALCHRLMVNKRKAMGIKVNEHPKYTDYLRYAEKLGLGIVDPAKIQHHLLSLG